MRLLTNPSWHRASPCWGSGPNARGPCLAAGVPALLSRPLPAAGLGQLFSRASVDSVSLKRLLTVDRMGESLHWNSSV